MEKQIQTEIDIVTNLKMIEPANSTARSTTIYELWQHWYQTNISKSDGYLNREKYSNDRLIDLMMERECIGFAKGEAILSERK